MRVSIVIPVFNTGIYLDACLQSVLTQTYSPFEIILADDGSTDGSANLCDEYAQKYPELIQVIHLVSSGPLIARQQALLLAKGDIIVFLDSDDCIRQDALQKIDECFCQLHCDMVLYNYSKRRDFSSKDSRYLLEDIHSENVLDKKALCRSIVSSNIPNGVVLKAAKKRCFDRFPDFTDLSYVKNGEDLLMTLYMVTEAQKIVYLDEKLYFYRQREGSIVHSYSPDRTRSIKTVHCELERFIDLWGMPELHPVHFAREVKSWIETVLILFDNKNHMEPAAFRDILQNMSADDYFRRAYAKMDPEALSGKYRLLAKWLYHRRFWCLQLADLFRTVKTKKSK